MRVLTVIPVVAGVAVAVERVSEGFRPERGRAGDARIGMIGTGCFPVNRAIRLSTVSGGVEEVAYDEKAPGAE
jgi:hypothetical protein